MNSIQVIPIQDNHTDWIRKQIQQHWGGDMIISRGEIYYPHQLPGFLAQIENEICGLVTYHIEHNSCQIISLNSLQSQMGIGSALINKIKQFAQSQRIKRLWLITTNDNLNAMRFYQKRGFQFAALHKNSVEESRKLKPGIPLYSDDGIPIRDEIEMEMIL
ncbi:MAG: GNAT family N-acetyltransferase [Anaerolineaceae bacterium]|nr:GNAT family N-acetyltransferase [Anaerolineaceae bacterium]